MLQLQGHVGILAGVVADVGRGEVTHILLPTSSRAYELLYLDGIILQIDLCQVVHAVAQLGLQQVVRHHGVEHRAAEFHTIALHDEVVVLDVLPYLQRVLILKHGT